MTYPLPPHIIARRRAELVAPLVAVLAGLAAQGITPERTIPRVCMVCGCTYGSIPSTWDAPAGNATHGLCGQDCAETYKDGL